MSIWQTESWQDMLIASGQSEEYFVIERDIENTQDTEYGPVFIEKRRVSLGEYGLFVIGLEGVYDQDLQESLEELCKEEKCLFLQIETIDYSAASSSLNQGGIELGGEGENSSVNSKKKNILNNTYYKKFIPPYTALIDLTLGEEEILKSMKPKGRYNIKVARKNGVVVEQVEKHIGNIKKFYALMSETTQRDAFAGNTLEYYKVFLESLDNTQMFFAYYQQEIIAAGIFVIQGDVMTYYYGASSSNKRNLMAPYLLQWTAIEHAIKRGYKVYDFLGVAGDEELNSSLAGVTDFKMKLCPKKTLISSSSIFLNKKIKYQVIMLLKKLRN